ncbi:hypothetical protein VaNZ11_003979 [Volvox africanus]|uniref:Uncharacterized protein n=1 Tax=Volvox africanus TaxID=51714 RepID=A0ABQ5RWZ6_9CHLO|nr:hypothetical protein VaNZ11_003979 [Volvox africanus]
MVHAHARTPSADVNPNESLEAFFARYRLAYYQSLRNPSTQASVPCGRLSGLYRRHGSGRGRGSRAPSWRDPLSDVTFGPIPDEFFPSDHLAVGGTSSCCRRHRCCHPVTLWQRRHSSSGS